MTLDRDMQNDDSFRGLMKNLNLDETQFKTYRTNFNQLTFSQLAETKKEIESQLSLLFDILKNNYNASMDTALVIDGFPRGDIDVVGVRLVRVKIIRLRNDLRDLLGLLEKKLAEQFSQVKQDLVNAQHEVSTEGEISPDPFATVTLVVENGPAYNSGLREGDRLVSFANVNIGTEDKLSKIAVITRSSLEKRIEVVVKRDSETKRISLVPTENWSGRGVLGCQLKID